MNIILTINSFSITFADAREGFQFAQAIGDDKALGADVYTAIETLVSTHDLDGEIFCEFEFEDGDIIPAKCDVTKTPDEVLVGSLEDAEYGSWSPGDNYREYYVG
jgi:hypothetical protein